MNIQLVKEEIDAIVNYINFGDMSDFVKSTITNKAERIMAENGVSKEDSMVSVRKYGFEDTGNCRIDINIEPNAKDVLVYNPILWLWEQTGLNIDDY